MAMSPEEIRAKYQTLRNRLSALTPTADRELASFLAEMLTEVAAQMAELNAKLSKVEAR